jgi:hypothetical protein
MMRFTNLFLACLVLKTAWGNPQLRQSLRLRSAAQDGSSTLCLYEQPAAVAPHKNIWQGLTEQEAVDVIALLHNVATGLNLTAAANASRYPPSVAFLS